jgi:dTDP-4-dehydrorhamnose reductase
LKVAIIGVGQLGSDLIKVFEDVIPLTHNEIEITDYSSCEILKEIKPHVVINTAAYHRTDECEINTEKTLLVNSLGARNIAKISSDVGAINIFISTDYVFDGAKKTPYTEDDAPNPINSYGVSKYAGELFTKYLSEKYYIIRVSSLFGVAGASGKGGNFVETMISKAKSEYELRVVNDITISPTYTMDASMAIKQIIEKKLPFGVYHVANDGFCTWYEFAREIFEIANISARLSPITSDEYPTKAKRPKNSALSVEKIKSYGINMRNWKEALRAYLVEKGHIS